jgi:acyl-phosphate glycerol 3-phosphate acyltransferase
VNGTLLVNSLAFSALAIVAAYLIGSIPFAYLVTYWVKGIDIRTVGSGNVGATNVGRTLGFRYFLLVLLLDSLKGFLPTLASPILVSRIAGTSLPELPVFVALATILGHTFPIYLKFRGGKGVATSLGTVLALDPVSCTVALVVFGGSLLMTRYVSLASLVGGLAFVAAHFARDPSPLSREHIAMSLFSIAVLILLFIRHRGNLVRIWAGTERRVSLHRAKPSPGCQAHPSGKAVLVVVAVLALAAWGAVAGLEFYRQATLPLEVKAGPWTLRQTDRTTTGQQRVDHVAFAAGGNRLAATCPRYDRLLVYGVEAEGRLELIRDIELAGRPVAVGTLGDRYVVLETPSGDQRHVEPGWWETFDLDGSQVGGRHPAGFYPDDMAVSPDGKHLFILSSGCAEGDAKKPPPSLDVIAVDVKGESGYTVGRITFLPTDDPCRLSLSSRAQCAAVLLTKTNQTLAIDLSVPETPKLLERIKPTDSDAPYLSYSPDSDWIMMPVASQSEGVAIDAPAAGHQANAVGVTDCPRLVPYLVCTRHRDSVLELFQTEPRRSLGRLPLKGPLNLGRTRPTGLAYSRERGLLAVATRSGTIHMVEMVPRTLSAVSGQGPIAARGGRHDVHRQ